MLNKSRASAQLFVNALGTTRSTSKRHFSHELKGGSACPQDDILDRVVDIASIFVVPVRRVFPRRLHHEVPSWVEDGSLFHIRIGHDREKKQSALTAPFLAPALLDSAKLYESKQRWHITLFLLMPDHVHGLLSFAPDKAMSEIIRDWKRFHTRKHSIFWQDGYFDHRLRDDERGEQLAIKIDYIRRNPVAAGLCAKAEDWPWIIDPFRAL